MTNKRLVKNKEETRSVLTTEAWLNEYSLKSLKNSKHPTDTGHYHSSYHQKWIPYKILGGKALKNVLFNP